MSNVTLKSKALEVQAERNKLSADKIASGTTVFGMTGSMESADALLRQITINTIFEGTFGVGRGLRSEAARQMWADSTEVEEHQEVAMTFNPSYRYDLTEEYRTAYVQDMSGLPSGYYGIQFDAFVTADMGAVQPVIETSNFNGMLDKLLLRQVSLQSGRMIDQVYYDFKVNKWYREYDDEMTGENVKTELTETQLNNYAASFSNDFTYGLYVINQLDLVPSDIRTKYKTRTSKLVDLLGLRLKIDN